MAEITKIEPLDGSNYQSWKYNIKLVLMERGLWGFVLGTEEPPGEGEPAALRRSFHLRSDKAYSLIALSVSKNLQVHIMSTTNPKIAWEILQKQFEFVSIAQIVRLNRKFYAATMNESDDLMEHLTFMTSLAEQLRELKEEISPQKFATVVLGSLPESYESFISSLNARKIDELDWENIKGSLVEEFMSRKDKDEKKTPNSTNALFLSSKHDRYSVANNYHSKSHNWRGKGRDTKPPQRYHHGDKKGAKGPQCFKCQEFGHIVKDCPLNKRKSAYSHVTEDCKGNKEVTELQKDLAVNFQELGLISSTTTKLSDGWFIDSAASKHMTYEKSIIHDFTEFHEPMEIHLGDNTIIFAYGEGKVKIKCIDGSDTTILVLHKILYVPKLTKNLISVPAMTQMGAEVTFDKDKCVVLKDDKKLILGNLVDKKLYRVSTPEFVNVTVISNKATMQTWHCRYGHLNYGYMNQLIDKQMVEGLESSDKQFDTPCESCTMGKMTRMPFSKKSSHRSTESLTIIHSDVCGPMAINSFGGSRYMLSFIDDYSRYSFVYFIKSKDEVFGKFREFVNLVENQTGSKVKAIRTDNGGEYSSKAMAEYCKEKGIRHELTNPYCPEQNGIAERFNRTIIEAAKSMLFHAKLPQQYWAEAMNTAVYLHNRSPTAILKDRTPYEVWFEQKPDVSNLRVFGCITYTHIPENKRHKLDNKALKTIFVGYPEGTKGYKLFDVQSKRFLRSRNVLFQEDKFHNFEGSNQSKSNIVFHDFYKADLDDDKAIYDNNEADDNRDIIEHNEQPNGIPQPVGATYEERFMEEVRNLGPKRQHKVPERFNQDNCFLSESFEEDIDEPMTVSEALKGKHAVQWQDAINSEYNSLMRNDTWELVPPSKDKKVIGSKWVLKVKRNENGHVDKFKARLVAQGYSQTYGIDYEDVFSPVAKYSAIRTLLALANAYNFEIHQLDVKTAFLNGIIDHDIYMSQPEGFVDPEKPNHLCKLKRSIYGLKQSARCWNSTLDTFLRNCGYQRSNADSCIYIKQVKNTEGKVNLCILAIYVDDILCISNDIKFLTAEKSLLCNEFEIVDYGEVNYILGMSITRNRESRTLLIRQPRYTKEILRKFGMDECKPVSTPMESGKRFQSSQDNEELFDINAYQQAIGCLTYLSTATRPDIAVAVNILSRFMSKPNKEHWSGVKRIFRYLKGTLDFGLKFSMNEGNAELIGFSDADWAGDLNTRHSTSGYIFQIGSSTVSWCSKKQATVAKSTTEAEYVALALATQEAIWLRSLLSDLGQELRSPTNIFEDNQGAIQLAKNPKFHNRTKHVDVTYHFIRERVNSNEISVTYSATNEMKADIMTKGLSKVLFEKFRCMLNVYPIP